MTRLRMNSDFCYSISILMCIVLNTAQMIDTYQINMQPILFRILPLTNGYRNVIHTQIFEE